MFELIFDKSNKQRFIFNIFMNPSLSFSSHFFSHSNLSFSLNGFTFLSAHLLNLLIWRSMCLNANTLPIVIPPTIFLFRTQYPADIRTYKLCRFTLVFAYLAHHSPHHAAAPAYALTGLLTPGPLVLATI